MASGDSVPELSVFDAFVMGDKKYEINVIWRDEQPWFKASEIGDILDMPTIRSSTRHFGSDEKGGNVTATAGGPQSQSFLTFKGVRRLLCKSRKPAAAQLARAFGMVVHENHYVCVEAAAVTFLSKALKGLYMRQQYAVGRYRIDLYFPKHKLALECDEEGAHGPGRVSNDRARQLFIENELDCTFLRFRPEQKGFDVTVLLNRVLRELHFL